MKTNIGDLVAQSMLNVLNSKEHARLFKKAYVEEGLEDGGMDMNQAKKSVQPKCKACNDMGDCAMCGDGNMSDDHLTMDDSDVSWIEDMMSDTSDDYSMSKEASKKVRAAYSALEDLITASAALDYADLGKASELAVKLATLVSEAKKGKVNMKDGKGGKMQSSKSNKDSNDARAKKAPAKAPAKKDEKSTSSTSKSTGSTSKSTSSTSSSASSKKPQAPAKGKKMTMKEKMEALRAKKK